MVVLIENIQNKVDFTKQLDKLIKDVINSAITVEDIKIDSEVGVMLVDNEKIREMNNKFRNIDATTDVLSFPMLDIIEGKMNKATGDYDMDSNLLLLGDIVISLEMAKKQSEEYGHSLEREVAFLTAHGIYHLMGYDHVDSTAEIKMAEKQEKVLNKLGLARK